MWEIKKDETLPRSKKKMQTNNEKYLAKLGGGRGGGGGGGVILGGGEGVQKQGLWGARARKSNEEGVQKTRDDWRN